MCYSGICIWEKHSGDCGFPSIKAVRDKYPLPLCGFPDNEPESQEYVNKIEDVKQILKDEALRTA